ncbi:MAG: hypothetical protein BroJett039_10950 [Chloroflexota bacterium]|nr:MAG: hypothetical protein BroJett039_10950 [Chloroflexota bacterium]
MARLKNSLKRLRALYLRSGFILNLRRVWLLIVIWAVLANLAIATNRDIFFRLSYLILLIVGAAFLWALYSVQSFRLERAILTLRAQVGKIVEERITAVSTGRVPKLWLELVDGGNMPGHPVGRVLSAMSPRVRYSFLVRSLCRLRGRFRLGPITASSGDPFGLFVFHRTLPETERALVVYPLTLDLPQFAPSLGNLRGGDTRFQRTHHVTTNVSGTREYAPGDSYNRIHWNSVARYDRLIVKEFELDPTADVWILLDLERGIHAGAWWEQAWYEREVEEAWMLEIKAEQLAPIAPNTEEYAVTCAASIAKYFLDKQRAVGLVASNHENLYAQPDRGERQLTRLLEMLAVAESNGGEPFASLIARETATMNRSVTLVLITPSAQVAWIQYAQDLRRRGFHLIVILIDASSFGIGVNFAPIVGELTASGIITYIVRQGDDLRAVLGGAPQAARA